MEKKSELTFFLRQVDPTHVATLYLSNELILPTGKIELNFTTVTPDAPVGSDSSSEIYEIVDKNGEHVRLITTDHDKWSKEKNNLSDDNYLCHWCRINNTGTPLLIPIRADREISTGKLLFHGTGSYCCFECAYADLKTKWYCGPYQRNYLYVDAETLLRNMFYIFTGKTDLKASPEWFLHKKNKGPLDDNDFFNSKHTYMPIPNIVLCTAKTNYIQTNK